MIEFLSNLWGLLVSIWNLIVFMLPCSFFIFPDRPLSFSKRLIM